MIMSKFKVGDKVRCIAAGFGDITQGFIYEVTLVSVTDAWYKMRTNSGILSYYPERVFEAVEPNSVLTPEEVFDHLRKGTKLQQLTRISKQWVDVIHPEHTPFEDISNIQWRVKPEPEVIELNGKRYKLIEE